MKQIDLIPVTASVTYALRAMALSDPQWQNIEPKRELVFPVGEPAGNDERRWRFTAEDLAAVAAEFGERTELAPAYYCHGEDPSRGKMAAGWIDRVELDATGLYAFIRYTDRALAEIKDGAWGYRSPGFDAEQDAEGFWRPRRLSEVSLVNDPAIGGMPPIKAAAEALDCQPAAINGDIKEEHEMDVPKTVTAAKKQSAAFDKPGLISLFRDTYAMPEAVSDEMLVKMVLEALAGAPEPDMPEAETKPEELPFPVGASVKPRIELVEEPKDSTRIVAAVQKAINLGYVTPQSLDDFGALASANIEAFERQFCVPPAPAAGQLIQASAADRKTQTEAQRLTARYQAQATRPHFTQRGN